MYRQRTYIYIYILYIYILYIIIHILYLIIYNYGYIIIYIYIYTALHIRWACRPPVQLEPLSRLVTSFYLPGLSPVEYELGAGEPQRSWMVGKTCENDMFLRRVTKTCLTFQASGSEHSIPCPVSHSSFWKNCRAVSQFQLRRQLRWRSTNWPLWGSPGRISSYSTTKKGVWNTTHIMNIWVYVYIYMYSMIWYNFRVDFSEKRDGTNQQKFNFPTASVHSSQQCKPLEPKWSPGALEPWNLLG